MILIIIVTAIIIMATIYRVITKSAYPAYSDLDSANPAPTKPGPPIIGVATAGNNSARIPWSAPMSNGGAVIQSYKIYKVGQTLAIATVNTSINPLAYTDTTALNGVGVSYQVSAVNAVGEGDKSAVSNIVTPVDNTTPPTPVTYQVNLTTGQIDNDTATQYTSDGNSGDTIRYNRPTYDSSTSDTTPIDCSLYIAGVNVGLLNTLKYLTSTVVHLDRSGKRYQGSIVEGDLTLTFEQNL